MREDDLRPGDVEIPEYRYSTVKLPGNRPEGIETIFGFFLQRFPRIEKMIWEKRFRSGKVFSRHGQVEISTEYLSGLEIHYFREVDAEPPVSKDIRLVYEDADLLLVDKPAHLPVIPGGTWIRNTLLMILEKEFSNRELTPLHRIDRLTSGLVLFSKRKETRKSFSLLFQPKPLLRKDYLAVCELQREAFPVALDLRSYIHRSTSAWWKQEIDNNHPPNSRASAQLLGAQGGLGLYRIQLESGRKHQLRVQLADAGLPILGDPLYGRHPSNTPHDLSTRMFLDAQAIEIVDFPSLSGQAWVSRETPEGFLSQAQVSARE